MNKRYYEPKGEMLAKLEEVQKDARAAMKRMLAFAKRHGVSKIAMSTSMGVQFYLQTSKSPGPDWKRLKRLEPFWQPRYSTKQGKALAAEMRELCKGFIGGSELADLIGMKVTMKFADGELRWFTPGMQRLGKRLVVTVPEYVTLKEPDWKRLTDVEVEKLKKKLVSVHV